MKKTASRFSMQYFDSIMGYRIIDNNRKNELKESFNFSPNCNDSDFHQVSKVVDLLNEGKNFAEYGIK